MRHLRKSVKILLRILLGIVAFIAIYAIVLFSLSRIAVNKDPEAGDYTVYIKTNGVHTDVILPVKNDIIDWSKTIKYRNTISQDSTLQYIAFGWGDHEFYLNTPTWADLKAKTAFQAAFYLGTSIMHVTFLKSVSKNESSREIHISKKEYEDLVAYISKSFKYDKEGAPLFIQATTYGRNDSFYEAVGKYSMFYTCNTWANDALKAASQKAALWTVTDTGIFCHYDF
jgi:uncharacterized protein (TIGR02117 family)